ncbi:Phosphate regulon sensor protein PhoR (SphS) [hydrothermal vent metagenome]|uniref:histidine kinase n=1 Tax=hydrothermal vent metagenome TaxID=652676 RepID=A0A3B0UH05_9ZZZZ
MVGLAAYLSQPGCLGSIGCIRQTVFVAAGLLFASTIVFAFSLTAQTSRPIRQLTQVIHRIIAGDWNARMLPQTEDGAGELVAAFNEMIDQLRTEHGALLEENGRFNTVLNTMADGVLITDSQAIVRFINPAFTKLFDVDEQVALDRSFAEVVRHHQIIDLWQRCQLEGNTVTEGVKVGRDLFLQVIVTPFEAQEARGQLVILQDLTQMRRLQTVRQDFISNISHELRTPLASLQLIVETLQDGAFEDSATAVHFLNRAAGEIDALTQMVEELLALSRIESGLVPLRLQETAVADLLLKPMDRLQPQAKRARIDLILDLPPALPKVLADPQRVHQIVTNLLHNAIKFTSEGGKITLKAAKESEENNAVIISVQDTGIGIPKEDLSRIFERFYKSDRARSRDLGGTGLGLAISSHLVALHNGRIWVKSKEQKGSTFYFTLPISQ